MSRKNCSNIGGQAVLEGVMMRGNSVMATAVRDPGGKIQVETTRFKPFKDRSVIYRIPVVRGFVSFITSMVMGMKTLFRATEVYGDLADEEPGKFEKWLAKTFKVDIMSVVTAIGVILGIGLALLLFVFVPNWISDAINKAIYGEVSSIQQTIVYNLFSGLFRLIIFVGYIAATRLMKDINRLYRYHGAEHKVISCYEQGLELTVENAQKMTTVHDRCGTTFMFIVMVFSVFFCSFLGWQDNLFLRVIIRIACIPVIAGISYELLKLFAKYDNRFVRLMKKPGLLLQKLTTNQPDDSMVEVSLTAFKTVLAMEADQTLEGSKFVVSVTEEKCKQELIKFLGDAADANEIDMMLMAAAGCKTRSEYAQRKRLDSTILDIAKGYAERLKSGMPVQYAIGSACFYGYDFAVNQSVLIPRQDTEILAEQAIKLANADSKVLELCTGSGAVAITVQKECGCSVVASDISQKALDVAKGNADALQAQISFVHGDLFSPISGKYDIIIANPPYIPSEDIAKLDEKVKEYEPRLALDGGEDGLDFYRSIAGAYKDYLNDNGVLLMEVGIGQAEAVSKLFPSSDVQILNDYNTPPVPRVVIVK